MRIRLLLENALLGIQTLTQNKVRSFLTALGVGIGVVIILAVASVLNGFRSDVIRQVEEFGTNNIYAQRFPFIKLGAPDPAHRLRKPIALADAIAIQEHCPSVQAVTPYLSRSRRITAKFDDKLMEGPELRGTFPNVIQTSNSEVEAGRGFTESENAHRASVAVIGKSVRNALFPDTDPIGKRFVVAGQRLRVIGALKKKKAGPFGTENPEDRLVIIPYNTFRKMFPPVNDHVIVAQAHSGHRDEAMIEIEETLRFRRKVAITEENDFELATADSIIEAFDSIISGTLTVMFLLSTIAFLVGGVGVMNIMLVSVTERTREIGIRKAIGARRQDIITQFLTEAAVLTGLGGLAGMIFAEVLLRILDHTVDLIHSETPFWARVFALGGSMIVGIAFGMWPAMKASRFDPIEALRYE